MKYKAPRITNKPIVTDKQWKELIKLGYSGNFYLTLSLGFDYYGVARICDTVIDWLRKKFNIIIYNSIEPFVDPCGKPKTILYKYSVKYCNLRDGWNGRVYIGESKLIANPYTAKRQAITLAICWLKKNGYGKKKNIQSRSTNHSRK